MPQTFAKVEQSLSQAIQKESVTRDIRQRGRLIRTVGPILSTLMLFLRALFAFLALPTIVGGVVPWLILRNDHSRVTGTPLGWPLVLFGASVLLWCIRDFYVIGKGTLAPWDPPKKLVTVGLYRLVRNPIYIGVVGYVLGWSVIAGSRRMAVYAVVLAVGFHLRVVFYEEPTLARQFGIEWHVYRANVNRWWPKRPSS